MNFQQLLNHEYVIPNYDRSVVCDQTKRQPNWIHFGAGNLFRALLCKLNQDNLNDHKTNQGIIAVSGKNTSKFKCTYTENSNLCIYLELNSHGNIQKNILSNICDTLALEIDSDDYLKLKKYFESEEQLWVTFTITEKGYRLKDSKNQYLDDVQHDFKYGPKECKSYFGMVSSLLLHRYNQGGYSIALTSFDNLQSNGQVLNDVVNTFAHEWVERGFITSGFLEYLNDSSCVTFPWTMTDKITPAVFCESINLVKEDIVNQPDIFGLTIKNLDLAVVNAEKSQYVIIEDKFPVKRPNIQGQGVMFTTRENVVNYELIKVTAALNPLHTTLSIFGSLLEIPTIYQCMMNPLLRTLVTKMGYEENIASLDFSIAKQGREFLKEVLEERFTNPFIKDQPSRIMTDTSMKMSIRFGETLKRAHIRGDNMEKYVCNLLSIAGWLRYRQKTSDIGTPIVVSPDPQFDRLYNDYMHNHSERSNDFMDWLLENEEVFGVNLLEIGVKDRILEMIKSMSRGNGSVESTLLSYLEEAK